MIKTPSTGHDQPHRGEPWSWDAVELAAAIRNKQLSCVEAVTACLDRLDEVNPRLNAVVSGDRDEVLRAAAAADAATVSGNELGPLHGVPVTTKITDDQAGYPTSSGVVAYRDHIATEDSPVIANLRTAGALLLGRTNSPPFAYSWWTENDLHGRTNNPWSIKHTPGGSSGGAAAGVAAGITPIAHGSDTMGSIRYPAYCTGIVGLRPSFGRVPIFRGTATAERSISGQFMETQGPLSRSVRDARLALHVMSRGDRRDPWWVPAPLAGPTPAVLRVAVSADPGRTGVHPSVRDAVERAAAAFEDAGYTVDNQTPPGFRDVAALTEEITNHELVHFHGESYERYGDERLRQTYRHSLRTAAAPSLIDYMEALARRTTWIRRWSAFLEQWPILLIPTAFRPPFPQEITTMSASAVSGIRESMMPSSVLPILGFPALAIPTGTDDGLPTGVQLVADRFREDLILAAGQILEDAFGVLTPIEPR